MKESLNYVVIITNCTCCYFRQKRWVKTVRINKDGAFLYTNWFLSVLFSLFTSMKWKHLLFALLQFGLDKYILETMTFFSWLTSIKLRQCFEQRFRHLHEIDTLTNLLFAFFKTLNSGSFSAWRRWLFFYYYLRTEKKITTYWSSLKYHLKKEGLTL